MAISSTTSPTFTASGLASGMDTTSIIDSLVKLESSPITLLQKQQTGLKTQLSQLGNIVSKLTALRTAAQDLASKGTVALTASSNTAFSAEPTSQASAGRYDVQVQTLARAAKWRSAGFAEGETVAGGTLSLTVAGVDYGPVTVQPETRLEDLAAQLRATNAPLSVAILSDGSKRYLSITARDTGFGDAGADAALSLSLEVSGSGADPGFARIQAAQNATFTVDGLQFSRTSNTVADAVPGTTLTLKAQGGAAEELLLQHDATGTQKKLQTFVDAYNEVARLVQAQLAVTKDTDRGATLSGDTAVRNLQAQLQRITATVVGASSVRTLADVGVKTARDGTLSIDEATLSKALAAAPSAVNGLFATEETGLGAVIDNLVNLETRSSDGLLTMDQSRLNANVSRMDDQIASLQRRVAQYRATLVAQFTAMEKTVSSLKAIGTYLTQQSQQSSSSK